MSAPTAAPGGAGLAPGAARPVLRGGAVLCCVAASLWLLAGAARADTGVPAPACPAHIPGAVASKRPGAARSLVPIGPVALRICAYAGLNPPGRSGRLERSATLTAGAELSRLVRAFDELRPAPRLAGCPMDDGRALLALFAYDSPPSDPVMVGLSGCRIVQNGQLTRSASLSPGGTLLSQLESLLR